MLNICWCLFLFFVFICSGKIALRPPDGIQLKEIISEHLIELMSVNILEHTPEYYPSPGDSKANFEWTFFPGDTQAS